MNNDFPDSMLYLLEQALLGSMQKKLKFNSYWSVRKFEPQLRYCDSFKDSLNATFSRIPIGNWNRNGYRARNNSSNFTIMQWKQWHYKNVYEEILKIFDSIKLVRSSCAMNCVPI